MKYIYASAGNSKNYGDGIIDYATREYISKYLPNPAAEQDMFSESVEEGDFDFMIIPGVTMLTPNARPFLKCLTQVKYPIYCLAGNYWVQSLPKPGRLVRSRIFCKDPSVNADLTVIKSLTEPIGARDPFTYELLKENSVDTKYMGCPTLHMDSKGCEDGGYVLFSFGRGHVYQQVRAAQKLAKKHQVICICHEPHDHSSFKAAGLKLPLIDFMGDISLYLSYFKHASVVVSGRLHGVLPAIAFGKRVFYFGTQDSRTSLLESLGIPIHCHSELSGAVERAAANPNRYLLQFFKDQWHTALTSIVDRHSV